MAPGVACRPGRGEEPAFVCISNNSDFIGFIKKKVLTQINKGIIPFSPPTFPIYHAGEYSMLET
jgi:hypothetical protein